MAEDGAEKGISPKEPQKPEEVELITSIFDKAKQIVENHGEESRWGDAFPSRVAYLDYLDPEDLRGHNRVLVWASPDNPVVVIDYSKNISKGKYLNTTVRLERDKVVSFNAPVEEWHGDDVIFREPWRPGIKPALIARYDQREFGHDNLNLGEVKRMLTEGKVDKVNKTKDTSIEEQRQSLLKRILRRK